VENPVTDEEYERWVGEQRTGVETYLDNQGINSPNVGPWPAFEMAPHFAIWAVESKKQQGKIGWWAFSGDCPIDYVSEDGKCHPRNALKLLLARWTEYIPAMKAGNQPPGATFGDGTNLPELGQLLEALADDSLWEDRQPSTASSRLIDDSRA
jgi:hypothetical protein